MTARRIVLQILAQRLGGEAELAAVIDHAGVIKEILVRSLGPAGFRRGRLGFDRDSFGFHRDGLVGFDWNRLGGRNCIFLQGHSFRHWLNLGCRLSLRNLSLETGEQGAQTQNGQGDGEGNLAWRT